MTEEERIRALGFTKYMPTRETVIKSIVAGLDYPPGSDPLRFRSLHIAPRHAHVLKEILLEALEVKRTEPEA